MELTTIMSHGDCSVVHTSGHRNEDTGTGANNANARGNKALEINHSYNSRFPYAGGRRQTVSESGRLCTK